MNSSCSILQNHWILSVLVYLSSCVKGHVLSQIHSLWVQKWRVLCSHCPGQWCWECTNRSFLKSKCLRQPSIKGSFTCCLLVHWQDLRGKGPLLGMRCWNSSPSLHLLQYVSCMGSHRVSNAHWPFKRWYQGLPWWRSGWESVCQCRGYGFEPWSGKIPHAAEQLGPWATIAEPARLEPVLHNRRGRDSERPAHRDEESPPLAATRESPRTETKTQHSKNK